MSCVLALSLASAVWSQQAPTRSILKATKTVPAMYVAYSAQNTLFADFSSAVPKAFLELWEACRDNGLRPLTCAVMAIRMEGPPQADKPIQWEAWVPVADQPTEEDLQPGAVVPIKLIPESRAAFTYHAGPLADISNTYIELVTWALGQGLMPTGEARVLATVQDSVAGELEFLFECQLGVQPEAGK